MENKSSGASVGGFKHYLHSGEKKHVFAGMVIIGVIFGIPWYYMNQGTKHRSHQDYLEKADKARSARLSSSPPSAK
ncbi:hypothetical protein MKX01_002374 [Papaver californicum]|nr:hypothetical protein MKX01_002374 [Papaver californicum]